ncbi:uncharacterized protein LOC134395399 [Elgaria multicarinata webbii]|uniref:uncharacterized protein LOC134395399 n=1 Tax=Elgaria multicarinata webbii TaxID=159646 RepID=UPI002FCD52F3
MFPSWFLQSILLIVFRGSTASGAGAEVRGRVGQNITLPCYYSTSKHGTTSMCWGRGGCPSSWCSTAIIRTDVPQKIYGQSSKYNLIRDIRQGDVSLTITNVTENDAGMYCCRVEITGPFNDLKRHVKVVIQKALLHSTPVRSTESYSALEPRWTTSLESSPDNVSLYFPTMVKEQRKDETSWLGLYVGIGTCGVLLVTVTLLLKWYLHRRQKTSNATSQLAFSGSETGGIQHVLETGVHAAENIYEMRILSRKMVSEKQVYISWGKNILDYILFFSVGTLSQAVIRGVVGQAVTLPCTYHVRQSSDLTHMCWGQGSCPNSKCSNEILSTDGRRVVSRKSYRYRLNGYVTRGDVSLTIANLNEGDKGIYCCRIEVQGWFNDLKKTLNLQVDKATTTAPTTTITTTSHMITTTVNIAPLTTAVTHPITSPFLSTTNPALPTISTATSVPTTDPSSASTAIAFLTTAPSFVNIKPSPTTLQDLSTKDGCSSFTTETAILNTVAMALPTTLPRFEETENADNCTDSNKDSFSEMDLAVVEMCKTVTRRRKEGMHPIAVADRPLDE